MAGMSPQNNNTIMNSTPKSYNSEFKGRIFGKRAISQCSKISETMNENMKIIEKLDENLELNKEIIENIKENHHEYDQSILSNIMRSLKF